MLENNPTSQPDQSENTGASPGFGPRLRRLLLILLIVGGVSGALFAQFYYIPRTAGDNFARAFLSLDATALERRICDEESAGEARRRVAAVGDDVIALIANTLPVPVPDAVRREAAELLRAEAAYNPFTSEYRFKLVSKRELNLAGFRVDAGFESPQVEVQIRRSLFSACVEVG